MFAFRRRTSKTTHKVEKAECGPGRGSNSREAGIGGSHLDCVLDRAPDEVYRALQRREHLVAARLPSGSRARVTL